MALLAPLTPASTLPSLLNQIGTNRAILTLRCGDKKIGSISHILADAVIFDGERSTYVIPLQAIDCVEITNV